jgi:hypothetical protein
VADWRVKTGRISAVHDLTSFIGLIVIGAALAVPLVYGVLTLLGMRHKRFHPIFRRKQPGGVSAPLMSNQGGDNGHDQTPDET